jgi:hypothetical protein
VVVGDADHRLRRRARWCLLTRHAGLHSDWTTLGRWLGGAATVAFCCIVVYARTDFTAKDSTVDQPDGVVQASASVVRMSGA